MRKPIRVRRWRDALLTAGLGLAALGAGGCEYTPDPCGNSPYGCIAVTVEDGPAEVHQLRVTVLDGYGSTTPLTPRKLPDKPLVYPLRFGIRFEQFDRLLHNGMITFAISGLDREGNTIGDLRQIVAIDGKEHVRVSVRIGAPFDTEFPDMAAPAEDFAKPPPDQSGADMTTLFDMP